MFENFPYTNFHDLNLDWIIQKVKEAYSPDNPPENVVLSVNGETGDVILYKDAMVSLPEIEESQWNIQRIADGQRTGIEFQGSKAQRIDGNSRYDIYDAGNPPPYPVRSVNGQTGNVIVVKTVNGENGDVILYRDAVITFPAIEESQWNIHRISNGQSSGIQFIQGSKAQRIDGTSRYDIYDAGNPPPYPVTSVGTLTGPVAILDTSIVTDQGTQKLKIAFPVTSVDGQTGTVQTWAYSANADIKLPIDAEGDAWSLNRDVLSGTLGVSLRVNGLTNNPEAYIVLDDGVNTPISLKILTPADIPSSSGVVSVNGANGVVTLYGTDIAMSSTDSSTTLEAAITKNVASIDGIEDGIAIVADNNTHGAISSGQFVYVKNHGTLAEGLYRASSNIAADATLSTANLIADSAGGLNALETEIASLSSNVVDLLNRAITIYGVPTATNPIDLDDVHSLSYIYATLSSKAYLANKPADVQCHVFTVGNGTRCVQYFYDVDNNYLYVRARGGTSWISWTKIGPAT